MTSRKKKVTTKSTNLPKNWTQVKLVAPMTYESEAWQKKHLRVLISKEPTGLHLSISHPYRYPTWDEIKDARDSLLPKEMYFVQHLPIEDEYVNVHSNCFHLWEYNGVEASPEKLEQLKKQFLKWDGERLMLPPENQSPESAYLLGQMQGMRVTLQMLGIELNEVANEWWFEKL